MLSILYVTRNRCEELKKSILSCEAHISMEHEYIIVDNGSADDTHLMVEDLIEQGLRIEYLKQTENKGVSEGRNIAFSLAKGEICYFIDDDAVIISDGFVLDDAYEQMMKHQVAGAMGTDCYDEERGQHLIGCREKRDAPNKYARIRCYIGCSHFIKKRAVFDSYLYPSNLVYGSEELYVGLTMYKNGFEVWQFSEVKVLHRPSKKTRESQKIRQRNIHVNLYVIKKYFLPGPFRILSWVLILARVIRFEKGDMRLVASDMKLAKQRYEAQYRRILSISETWKLCRMFGVKNII